MQEYNFYVALSEEFPNVLRGKIGGLMFDRKISRVITPGTLIDEKFLDAYENNFLLALSNPPDTTESSENSKTHVREALSQPIGLAWLDLSTGGFFTQRSTMAAFGGDIARIGPREVVISEKYREQAGNLVVKRLEEDKLFVTYYLEPPPSKNPIDTWKDMLETPVRLKKAEFSKLEIEAGTNLLSYVKARLPGLSIKLQPPIKRFAKDIMGIDSNSMRSLEIKQTLRDGHVKGSLMHSIKRTVTKSGSRLLSSWLG